MLGGGALSDADASQTVAVRFVREMFHSARTPVHDETERRVELEEKAVSQRARVPVIAASEKSRGGDSDPTRRTAQRNDSGAGQTHGEQEIGEGVGIDDAQGLLSDEEGRSRGRGAAGRRRGLPGRGRACTRTSSS